MSLDASTLQRTISPVSSGRSSPAIPRLRSRDEDSLVKKDKGYRRYASGVERVLSSFETTVEEWADYISFLGRLLKALQSKPSGVNTVPHRALISKRLSQCLNPVLPSGVHQKTLEVYAYIFATLGKNGLSANLSLYLPGLMPVFSFAALSVKPAALTLFEMHVVVLDPVSLRPALKAILLALLPCLEEDTADEFDRTIRILDTLKQAVGKETRDQISNTDASGEQYFWQCMFLASITSRSRRPGALAYLIRNLPRLGQSLDAKPLESLQNDNHDSPRKLNDLNAAIQVVASPEPGLLIRCFCAGLRDEQLLTQRGFLDLLVTNLPMHSPVLQEKVVPEDLETLISAATSVVARRDMSLNRRLWSWFLGPDFTGDGSSGPEVTPGQEAFFHQTRYFEQYGLKALVDTIRKMIEAKSQNPVDRARPLRICLSLMDRWEVGGLVIPQIFLPAMRSVWQYQSLGTSRESTTEVLRSANMFFDGVESGLIWAALTKVIIHAFESQTRDAQAACDDLMLVIFIVTNFNVREEEMLVVHLPVTCLVLMLRVHRLLRDTDNRNSQGRRDLVLFSLKIVNRLLELIPPRAFASDRSAGNHEEPSTEDDFAFNDEVVLARAERFYTHNHGNLDLEGQPLAAPLVGQLLLQTSFKAVTCLTRSSTFATYMEADAAVNILNIVIRRMPRTKRPHMDHMFAALFDVPKELAKNDQSHSIFPLIAAKISALDTIYTAPQFEPWISEPLVRQLIPRLVMTLWPTLSPSKPKFNVEAVRCIWRLQSISPDKQLIEGTISTLLISAGAKDEMNSISAEDARRFATLWTHSPTTSSAGHSRRSSLVRTATDTTIDTNATVDLSVLERPLLLLLDILDAPNNSLFNFVVDWVQSLPNLHFIVTMLVNRLPTSTSTASEEIQSSTRHNGPLDASLEDNLDTHLCLYYMQLMIHLMQFSPNNVWPALATPSASNTDSDDVPSSNAIVLARVCLNLLKRPPSMNNKSDVIDFQLSQAALSMLRRFLDGPSSAATVEIGVEDPLLDELVRAVEIGLHSLQRPLMEVVLIAMKARLSSLEYPVTPRRQLPASRDIGKSLSGLSISTDGDDRRAPHAVIFNLPSKLLRCLSLGLTSRNSRPVLDDWITFLGQCLPLYADNIFQILIPLVECFCNTLATAFQSVQTIFGSVQGENIDAFEPTIGLLLNGLEQTLATAHDRLMTDEVGGTPVKSPEQQQQGFFGNMVSGVFSLETNRARTTTANNRLTVLLCFKDAVRVCFTIWSWGDYGPNGPLQDNAASASFNYTILRLRNRTRRIFEHLFAAEALECLETLIELWLSLIKEENVTRSITIFNLIHVLEGSRPKNTIPAIFNAIYSRTNPAALDPVRKSTLTSNLSDISLAGFLVAYTRSLEDDAMDEIWTDCITFLKDVLANPMPHRQTLPKLLEFTAILGEKVDNTNFGEQRKMRRELGDLFVRLLAATLTIRPVGFSFEAPQAFNQEKLSIEPVSTRKSLETRGSIGSEGFISVLASIAPNLSKVLVDSDRIASTIATISTQVIGPTFRSRNFPENLTQHTLDLVIAFAGISEASRTWKKDVAEAFNDPRFFSNSLDLAQQGWLPLVRQWALADKERMPELLSRLTLPTSAGIVFGVGATSARLEADRKTQLNLRRVAFLILSATKDTFVVNVNLLQEKLVDLLNATAASSPSATTRAEIYMVIRALLLKTSAHHLAVLWPTINSELYDAIYSVFPGQSTETYIITSLLQACKLLDTLLTLELDDFQMQEWLFINDTTDAIYRSLGTKSAAMVDELAEELDSGIGASNFVENALNSAAQGGKRRPLLTSNATKGVEKTEIMEKVLRPFFRQLSIYAFESTYSMKEPDWKACFDDLMCDLFDDTTLV